MTGLDNVRPRRGIQMFYSEVWKLVIRPLSSHLLSVRL